MQTVAGELLKEVERIYRESGKCMYTVFCF